MAAAETAKKERQARLAASMEASPNSAFSPVAGREKDREAVAGGDEATAGATAASSGLGANRSRKEQLLAAMQEKERRRTHRSKASSLVASTGDVSSWLTDAPLVPVTVLVSVLPSEPKARLEVSLDGDARLIKSMLWRSVRELRKAKVERRRHVLKVRDGNVLTDEHMTLGDIPDFALAVDASSPLELLLVKRSTSDDDGHHHRGRSSRRSVDASSGSSSRNPEPTDGHKGRRPRSVIDKHHEDESTDEAHAQVRVRAATLANVPIVVEEEEVEEDPLPVPDAAANTLGGLSRSGGAAGGRGSMLRRTDRMRKFATCVECEKREGTKVTATHDCVTCSPTVELCTPCSTGIGHAGHSMEERTAARERSQSASSAVGLMITSSSGAVVEHDADADADADAGEAGADADEAGTPSTAASPTSFTLRLKKGAAGAGAAVRRAARRPSTDVSGDDDEPTDVLAQIRTLPRNILRKTGSERGGAGSPEVRAIIVCEQQPVDLSKGEYVRDFPVLADDEVRAIDAVPTATLWPPGRLDSVLLDEDDAGDFWTDDGSAEDALPLTAVLQAGSAPLGSPMGGTYPLLDPDADVDFFTQNILDRDHASWILANQDIVSIASEPDESGMLFAKLWAKAGNVHYMLPDTAKRSNTSLSTRVSTEGDGSPVGSADRDSTSELSGSAPSSVGISSRFGTFFRQSDRDRLRKLAPSLPTGTDISNAVKMRPELAMDLGEAELQSIVTHYKFGVLYRAPGQTAEDEIYSNRDGSEAFHRFLEVLGTPIQLAGWDKYRAGLDVKAGTTGEYSVYTTYRSYELMYHVATLLPYMEDNPQQLHRKRQIGNDIVVVIFSEGDEPFNPAVLTSHFNHVFFVVQWDEATDRYRVTVAAKEGVPQFGPPLPRGGVFVPSAQFREWLMAKLVNGERAAYHAPVFRQKFIRTRKAVYSDLCSRQ